MERRRFSRAAGVGAVLGLSGYTGNTSPPQANNETTEGSGGSESGDSSTQKLTLATTTSTYDTGLLDTLNPVFEEKFNARVKTILQGTGAVIEVARNDDTNVILVHARGVEDEFLQDGYGVNRRDVMFNDFAVVGPADDPAGISRMESAADAFATVADTGATFVSRGNNSGTNGKELLIWEAAGVGPSGTWYRGIGKGMGDTLVQANQSGAYTLSDRRAFLATQGNIDLEIQVQSPLEGGPTTPRSPYGVIPVNPAKCPDVNYSLAMVYTDFLTGLEGQEIISNYTANGSQLFFPNALSGNLQFGQYVPVNYDDGENAPSSASVSDVQFELWVTQHVPGDSQSDRTPPPPVLALGDLNLTYLVSITAVSLYASTAAVVLNTVLGLPTSLATGFRDFYGRSTVTSVISTGMGFPSVVMGLVALLMLSRSESLGAFELLFIPEVMILSQTILALPVLVGVSLSAVQSVPQDLRDTAFAAGGTSTDIALLVIREACYGIVTALLAAYGRVVSEVGPILIIDGNIVFSDSTSFTQTLTTTITVEARKGNIETGIALGAVLLALVLGMNALGARFRGRTPGRNRRER